MLPAILTPPAPESVSAPAEVVKFEAAPPSSDIPPDESIVVVVLSISTFPSKSTLPVTDKSPLALT